MITIFLGAPGSGKGTVSDKLKEKGYKHISTGEIFRATIKSGSELGNKVKGIIESGSLVDDKTTADVLTNALGNYDMNNDKIIIDGYPRNIAQAEFLEQFLNENSISLHSAIYLDVDEEIIIKRLSGRMMCKTCGKGYNKIFLKPEVEGKCDVDGSELYQREDDKEENVKARLEVYNEVTSPLIEYYTNKNLIRNVQADDAIDTIVENTIKELEN